VAVWPRAPGWLIVQTGGVQHQVYVHDAKDWILWQRAQRHDATARYLARTPDNSRASAPAAATVFTPFAVLFALAMLLLWWRERR
jgi:hypothetical protein